MIPVFARVILLGFLGGSDSKESACNVGDPSLIPELGRSPGDGNGNPLQYSCLENPLDRGGWIANLIQEAFALICAEVSSDRAKLPLRAECMTGVASGPRS
ncbi:unnamed protein product [Rangifer tarandus platyrhynchus]|uniref:Uncharacterized protein n=2 Tax=Rangifer tarandus platyrhynchus TaxID=3082113 RepID=A0AC59ZWS5_RANTA|nr:unnamed protein product [Rangifer tarandus platyrhynchus]